ncbi:unnamed protein product [Orchesella dallaii]|uniref:SAM domain-containing protein n=1 Tax=Orchesella dallaii TaxID=48710 RepID=A0ABP1PW10_9HEXA
MMGDTATEVSDFKAVGTAPQRPYIEAVSSSATPLEPGTNGAVEGKKRGPGRPRKIIKTVPPVPSQVVQKCASPKVVPVPIPPNASAVGTAPLPYVQAVSSSETPLQPGTNGAVEGKKRGPGRPRKIITTIPPVPSQAVKKCAPPNVVPVPITPNASAARTAPPRTCIQAVRSSPLQLSTNGAVEEKRRRPGRPRKTFITIPPPPSPVADKSALPIVSPEPIAPKANAVGTAPRRPYIQAVSTSETPLEPGTNGAVEGKKRGPGRPPKSTTPIPPSSQVVKKNAISKVETTEPIPAKASAVGTTSRCSSIQQQAQQLKVEQNVKSTFPEDMDTSQITASPPEAPVVPKMEIDSGTDNTDSESIGLENLNGGTRLGGSAKTESTSRKSSTDTESSSTGAPPKIPILSPDNSDRSCCENVDPSIWGPKEVVAFLDANGYGDHSDGFLKNKISGSSLMALGIDEIVILTEMKVGPALKILSLIDQLKRSVKSRNALGK